MLRSNIGGYASTTPCGTNTTAPAPCISPWHCRDFTRSDRIATVDNFVLQLHTSVDWNWLRTRTFISVGKNGYAAMRIYLFRSASSSRTFAYTLDVTARNIARETEHAEWLYVRVLDAEELEGSPEVLQRLRADGFYLFNE
jgi:hypothetical protein